MKYLTYNGQLLYYPQSGSPFLTYGQEITPPFLAIGHASNLYKPKYTLDGGSNWYDGSTGSYTMTYQFLSMTQGAGSRTTVSPNLQDIVIWSLGSGVIKHISHDAGETWAWQYFSDSREFTHWNKQNNTCYIGGFAVGGLKSTNAGDSFTQMSMGNNAVCFDSSDDESYVFAGMMNNTTGRSTNQGANWSLISNNGTGDYTVVRCSSSGQYVINFYGARSKQVCFSSNYGASYTALANSTASRATMNRSASIIVYDNPANNRIYISSNQGSSWSYFTSPFGTNVSVTFSPDETTDEVYLWARNDNRLYKINAAKDGVDLVATLPAVVHLLSISSYGRGAAFIAIDQLSVYLSYDKTNWTLVHTSVPTLTYITVQ